MGSRIITVAQDGAANYRTVQEAIDAVPLGNACRTVIRVAPGVYRQPLYVAKTKNFITLAGISPESTVLTWHNTATHIEHNQAARVIGTGTFGCGSVIVEGEDFIAENITFENSAPQGSGQAVAIRVTADRCAFYNCRFLGWQDTLYLHYGKQYLRDCYVEGSVDFIFGNSTALLEHCHIHCKSSGYITAQSRKSSQETTGYVFLRFVTGYLSLPSRLNKIFRVGNYTVLVFLASNFSYAVVIIMYKHLTRTKKLLLTLSFAFILLVQVIFVRILIHSNISRNR
ncbi:hypothetical protein ACS0TY_029036 [Phlomoides rotata]